MDEPQVHVIASDDVLPKPESETRRKFKKAVTTVTAVGATVLLADQAIKRFRARKRVTLTVADKQQPES